MLRMAEEKAAAVAANHNGKVVLAADTTVACGRRILGQPEHAEEARQFLTLLSGRRHRVYTAVALVGADGQCRSQRVMTQVAFRRLSDGDIQAYLDSGEWEGKAGGYGIQGYAARFVRRINGSYTSVVGLPLDEAWQMLKSAGAI